ncbi:MAG: hypothetical protein ACJ8MR_10670 [Povalibacter sp.]
MRITVVYWVLATIFLLIALTVPRLRPIGIVGSVILGLMLAWGVLQRLRGAGPEDVRGSPSAPTSAVTAFPLTALKAEQLRLAGNGAPFELRGHVTNNATAVRLRSFTVEITRRDCYEGALDPSGCVTLWQTQQWVELMLNPGESREFANSFWTRGDVPRARGTVQDQFEVVAADGQNIAAPLPEKKSEPAK